MADWFVDLSAANNGDGTDGAQAAGAGLTGAFNVLTATELAGINAGDTVWIRRTDGTGGSKKTLSFKDGTLNNRIQFNGWPVNADDEHWVAAQASGNTVLATWNADPSAFVVINPFGASAAHQHRVYRRLYWDETASAANEPFATLNTSQETRWHKCQARRATATAPLCSLYANTGAGRLELDDVHVIGTGPSAGSTTSAGIWLGFGNDFSGLIRVRFTFTGATNIGMNISAVNVDFFIEILEWNDSGTNYVKMGGSFSSNNRIGGIGTRAGVFTTDDDAVGMLPAGDAIRSDVVSTCGLLLIRNLDFEHANSPAPTNPTMDVSTLSARSIVLENIRFPASVTTHLKADSTFVTYNLLGRNLFIDTAKILRPTNPNNAPWANQIHLVQINGTNAWFRSTAAITAQTSNINRSGGHANGILVETYKLDATWDEKGFRGNGVFAFERPGYEAMVFPRFGLGFPVTQTLTIYFATVFWDGREDKNNIWIEATAYRDSTGFHRKIYDSRKLPGSVLIADGSTWNNISGHNAWRIEMPIDLVQDDIVQVRFFVADSFRNGGGAQNVTIFDPALTLA